MQGVMHLKRLRLAFSVVLAAMASGIVALTMTRSATLAAPVPAQRSLPVENRMMEAANRFLAQLTEEQRVNAVQPFLVDERFNW